MSLWSCSVECTHCSKTGTHECGKGGKCICKEEYEGNDCSIYAPKSPEVAFNKDIQSDDTPADDATTEKPQAVTKTYIYIVTGSSQPGSSGVQATQKLICETILSCLVIIFIASPVNILH